MCTKANWNCQFRLSEVNGKLQIHSSMSNICWKLLFWFLGAAVDLGLFRMVSLWLNCNIAKSGGFSSNDTCHCFCPQPILFRVSDSKIESMDANRYYFKAVTVGQMDNVIRKQFHCFSLGQKFPEWPYHRSAVNKALYRYCSSLSVVSMFAELMEPKLHMLFTCLL